MAKFFYLATIFILIGLTFVRAENHVPLFYRIFKPFITPTTICGNTTVQTAYYTQTVALINSFQANATYNAVLQLNSPNFVAYIKNAANQVLLNTNCTAFVAGVKSAEAADQAVRQARRKISEDISKRIDQIPHQVTNSKGPNVLDPNEKEEHHHH